MNNNTLRIIERIIINKSISVSKIAEETSYSKRQIEYQISEIVDMISEYLPNVKDDIYASCAILDKKILDVLEKIYSEHANRYTLNQEEREFYIFLSILTNKEYLSIYHLTNALQVGKTTVIADIKKLKRKLMPYDICINSDRLNGYTLHGEPMNMFSFLLEEINHVHKQVILSFCSENLLRAVENYHVLIEKYIEESGIIFVESRLEKFIYFLLIIGNSTTLLSQCRLCVSKRTEEWMPDLYETILAKKIFEALNIPLNSESANLMGALLISISVSDINTETPDKVYLLELLRQVMTRFQALSGLRYDKPMAALAQLYSHFRPAYYRCTFDLPVDSSLTDQIVKEYSAKVQLVKEALKPLHYIIGATFSEAETALLALHFVCLETAGTKEEIVYRKKCAVICDVGTGFSVLLKKQLSELFPEIEFFSMSLQCLVKRYESVRFDAIFSSSIKYDLTRFDVPIFYISALLTPNDKYLLSRDVYKILFKNTEKMLMVHDLIHIINHHASVFSEEKLYEELIDFFAGSSRSDKDKETLTVEDMIHPELIQTNLHAETMQEAIMLSAAPLLNQGYILPEYVSAVLKNVQENEHHTVIMENVALPHASPECGVIRAGITVNILEKPVAFDANEYDPVKYIFFLAAKDYDSHTKVMAHMLELLERSEFVEVLNSRNKSTIWSYITK